jgi:formate-dependent nitrite reductase membrane component NrfD
MEGLSLEIKLLFWFIKLFKPAPFGSYSKVYSYKQFFISWMQIDISGISGYLRFACTVMGLITEGWKKEYKLKKEK